jgi:methionyl-tRNA synthetase
MKSTYYLSTAIPYANAAPHIGYALEALYADAMARYQRLLGHEVFFLIGTDEHG